MFRLLLGAAALLVGCGAVPHAESGQLLRSLGAPHHSEVAALAPKLSEILRRIEEGDAAAVAEELRTSPGAEVIQWAFNGPAANATRRGKRVNLPVVAASGMGDSCFNAGMINIANNVGAHLDTYARCVPTGDTAIGDTLNSFLMTMDNNVDEFAERVKNDPELANGFNAFGISQGTNVIRGYMHRYQGEPGYPVVDTLLSLSSPIVGVGAFPMCSPEGPLIGIICQLLAEVLGSLAYLPLFQSFLFQANYFRDPTRVETEEYLANSQLAQWNNEGVINEQYRQRFLLTRQVVAVKALRDTVVWPVNAQQFGAPAPGTWVPEEMRSTRWYQEDLFGLLTMDLAGRLGFEEFDGPHIGFTNAELLEWVDRYFRV